MKTCPATVCEVYHAKNKDKICGLRWDSLAQILSGGGIRSGSRVLVFDSVLGLVVGSIAYRLRGNGVILAAYAGQQPHFEIVNTLNLDEHSQSTIQVSLNVKMIDLISHFCDVFISKFYLFIHIFVYLFIFYYLLFLILNY